MSTYAKTGTLYEVGLYSLGESLIKFAFREASAALWNGATSFEVRQSLAFIRGSGLETVIEDYGLALDPDKLRETFYQWGEKLHKSVSSSATTSVV